MSKRKDLTALWRLVQKWEGEKEKCANFWAGAVTQFDRAGYASSHNTYRICILQLARALARLERKGKG